MKALILALMMAAAPSVVIADELRTADDAVALADKAMAKIVAEGIRAGMDSMKPFWVVPEAEVDAMIGKGELQMPVIQARFGKPAGYELLHRKQVGESLLKVVYLQKFEKHAMVMNFVFYRSKAGWTLNSFNFKDDLGEVL